MSRLQCSHSLNCISDVSCEGLLLPPSFPPSFPPSSHPSRSRTPSSRSQWALRDLICVVLISVGTAGSHLRGPDLTGHGGISSAWSWSQWALSDLNCEIRPGSGHIVCVGLVPHRECRKLWEWFWARCHIASSGDLTRERMSDKIACKISTYMQERMPDEMPNGMSHRKWGK